MSRALREQIDTLFRIDADLDAFCLDEFPEVSQRFSAGMDRVVKVNLLLQLVDRALLLQRLDDRSPQAGTRPT